MKFQSVHLGEATNLDGRLIVMIRKLIAVFFLISLMPLSAFGGDNGSNLIDAAFKGDIDTVKQLLDKGVNPNSRSDGETALKNAALKGHTEIV
jgi:hypothetical protein